MVDSGSDILSYFTNRIQAAKEQQLKELDLSVPRNTHNNDKLDHIPEAVFELTQLESLDLRRNGIKILPESIDKLTNLTSLNLGGNGITTLPESITKLTNLTSLDLGGNRIEILPESITKLTNLTSLNLGGNGITTLPESIAKLTNLTNLNLGGNGIANSLKFIEKLTNLINLDLGENGITNSLKFIEKLTNLTSLSLRNNEVTTLSESITKLTNLTSLNLWGNGIITLPEFITKLTSLTRLDLGSNRITTLPESITKLTSLARLDLGSNRIITLPESITKLTNLTSLDLRNNEIITLPESITKLTNLTSLDLRNNEIITLPESITKLTNLTNLDLRNNEIVTLPESIAKLTNLTHLNLGRNRITTLPGSITKLTNLTHLYLGGNGITIIPEFITKLTNLTHLYLGSNGITIIPESIEKLTNLISLNLGENRIAIFPEFITKLNNLISLDLRKNRIKILPESIEKLTNLSRLYLGGNAIKTLPKSIGKTTNLSRLYLRKNEITTFPESITKLTNLIVLKLDDNEIEIPPIEIVNRGIKSIRDYFRQLSAGQDYIYEAKLIVVGEGGAGKTTLAKKIDNPQYELQQDEPTTEGIDVIIWEFDLPEKKREFKVNIWDFGGQEIYHATHQFFLTKRSLYALVADTRKEDTDFYYWMNVVELLTDNSPVLIIKNEKQDRHREIDERRLRGEFTNLREVLATNLKNNRGLDIILDKIQHYIKHLPLVGTPLPKTWVDVRKKLKELKEEGKNYISLDAYLTICEANGFDNYENSLQLSQYLHDLGVCLHFQDDPVLKNTVILEPEWGTDAVYKVLDDNTIIRNLGCFSKQDLANIWHDSKYQRMHNELLQLMIKFKLCYEIPYQKDHYIAPQLLTLNQPDYDWNPKDNLLLRYSYEFMPKGILTRFIVEIHKSIDQNHVWRNGVILTDNYALGEVIEYYDKKEIRIKISGNNKRDMMSVIIREIDKINDSYERIKYSKLIPCNCPTCVSEKEPHFYRLQELKERVAYKQEYIGCGKPPFYQVKVLDLIDDVYIRRENQDIEHDPVPKPKTANNNTMKTIKIFLASSSELESDRKEFQIFIANKNKVYVKKNIFLEVVLWEDFIDAMSATRLQDEYNKAVEDCDIFVSLFHTKVGKYTEEEFSKALETFKANDKPLIYTYFKDEAVNMSQITDKIVSLINFQNKLKDLEHYPTNYADINDLKYKFGEQLIKVLPKLTGISQNNIEKLSNQKNQDAANIVQNFYGNVGNVARDQNLTDANIQSDRNTMDKSRNINISGNATVNASGAGAFNLGNISGTVANTINQLPNFDNQPDKQKLKELLSQLQNAVSESKLDQDDKEDTLEQIQVIAEALPDNQNKKIKRKAKGALGIIQDIAQALPPGAAMVTICNQLPDLISKIF